jgi:hypothetical protein
MMRITLAWAAMLGVLLGAGSVRTSDGRVLEGKVRLEQGLVVVEQAGEARGIDWELVEQVRLGPEPAPIRPAGSADGTLPAGWIGRDIGPVRRAGSSTCDMTGLFTIRASGWGAWGPDDAFHFVHMPWKGDGQIMARVAAVERSQGQMVAGVMIRESLADDAPMAAACLHPSGQVRLNRRPAGDPPEFRRPDEDEPRTWLRLTRRGDLFTAYRSTDGRMWVAVDSFRVPMNSEVLIGLSAWTLSNMRLGEVRMDSVLIVGGTPGATWHPDGDGLLEGVVLRNGDVLAGPVQSAGEDGVLMLHRGEQRQVPLAQVARLVFNPVAPETAAGGRPGLWLAHCDFVEGRVMAVTARPRDRQGRQQVHVSIRSLLFGQQQFDAPREVTAVVLADVAPAPAAYEVRTADGSRYRVDTLQIEAGVVYGDGVAMADVARITRLRRPASPQAE